MGWAGNALLNKSSCPAATSLMTGDGLCTARLKETESGASVPAVRRSTHGNLGASGQINKGPRGVVLS